MKLVFQGEPMPKQSARFRIVKGKSGANFISSYQKKSIKDNAKSMALQAKAQLPKGFKPLDCPISIKALFVFPLLKGFSKKKVAEIESGKIYYKDTKPDGDNCFKNSGDFLEGLLYTNDSRICNLEITKIYGTEPRTEIEITEL